MCLCCRDATKGTDCGPYYCMPFYYDSLFDRGSLFIVFVINAGLPVVSLLRTVFLYSYDSLHFNPVLVVSRLQSEAYVVQ